MGFLTWLIVSIVTAIPMFKLLPHFGVKQNWALACFVPLGALVLLWVMSMKLQDMERR